MKGMVIAAMMAFSCVGVAQEGKKIQPAMVPIKDDPKLPRVLLIGDSISIGYTIPTRKGLEGKANVHRILTNGGPTTNGLKNLDTWIGKDKWDVIHFNWGLHDLKIEKNGKHQVPIEEYEKNLRELVMKLKGTGAKLIWASTTPVPEGKLSPPRSNEDVNRYNSSATKIMNENGIEVNDLYAFALERLKEIQKPVNVHFSDKGSEVLGVRVAGVIEKALPAKK